MKDWWFCLCHFWTSVSLARGGSAARIEEEISQLYSELFSYGHSSNPEAILKIQVLCRKFLSRYYVRRRQSAIVKAQSFWRSMQAQTEVHKIQYEIRKRRSKAAVIIQSLARVLCAHVELERLQQEAKIRKVIMGRKWGNIKGHISKAIIFKNSA